MKLSAWLFLLLGLNGLVTISVTLTALILVNRQLLILTLALLTFSLVLLIAFRLSASGARCPLCTVQILLSRRCQRNRNAQRTLGSYRARVARDIVLTRTFRCPYCGEPTQCSPRRPTGTNS